MDFEYLKEMQEQRKIKEEIYKKNVKREKADYKCFFAVEDMQLMFYSERNGFYKYFSGIIDYICEHSDIQIHYISSDPEDKIFYDPREQIHPYFIASDRFLIPLFMKLDCKMCVMTMPDLEKYHVKRSRVRNDIEYVYVFHAMGSHAMTLRKGALDWYDTIFCMGKDTVNEIRESEELYNTKKKRLIETGYILIDEMVKQYNSTEHVENDPAKILIAPSWQPDNIVDTCVDELLGELSKSGYDVILRPHPQQVLHNPQIFEILKQKYEDGSGRISIQTDFSSNSPVLEADLLITDWSNISFEYAFTTKRPVLFINTPMKIMNPEYNRLKAENLSIGIRSIVGKSIDPDNLANVNSIVSELISQKEEYREIITAAFEEHMFNIGKSAALSGKYIIKRLQGLI